MKTTIITRFFLCSMMIVFITPVLSAQPSIGGFNVYYGHLHNHCNVSDGIGTPDAAYYYAKNTANLDFFSLSDHSGAIDATEWAAMKTAADAYNQAGVFTAFRGFEWTSSGSYGHVAVINTNDYCTTSSPTNTFSSFCDWLNARECAAFFNHPGRENAGGTEFSHFATTPSAKLVGMELWNKNDAFSDYYYNDGYYSNDGNKGYYDEAITRNWRIGASGSEDNHSGNWGNYNSYRLAVLATANTRDDIYNALKAKRFFSTLDKNIALSFKINGNEMGSIVLPGAYSLHIQASDADGELFTEVRLLKNGAAINTWTPNSTNPDITTDLAFNNAEYYYIIVKQSDGNEAISSPIWISDGNLAPIVSITNPVAYDVFPAPANIVIAADASDPDGTISKVEFYQGTTLLGEDLTSPYTFNWTNVQAGSYIITARATDNLGGVTTSLPVSISVVNPGDPVIVSSMVAGGTDDAEESAAGAMYLNSTDIELVYDTYNSAGNQTVGLRFVNLDIPQNAVISNAYVQFTCDEITTGACNLVIKAEATDNSAAFTSANFNISGRQTTSSSAAWTPPAWNIVNEANTNQRTPNIAQMIQEVVNRTGYSSSSAISIIITGTGTRTAEAYEGAPTAAAKLFVTYFYPFPNQPPTVSVTSPGDGSTFIAPATINIAASASDADGNITSVEFYVGSTLLGTDNTSPYEFTWSNVAAGSYTLLAKAYDNDGASTISLPVNITVTRPNQSPVVSITSPVPGATYTAPANITITASASDPDGTITNVEFYQGSTLLGSDNTSPYSCIWMNAGAGKYLLTAKATDNAGATTISDEISITVNLPPSSYTFTKQILSGPDDVEENSKGTMLLNSDDIELVYDTKATGNQVVGLRFTDVSVPKGATVTNAYIQFTVDEPASRTCRLTIKGENSDNAAPFTSLNKNVSGRIKTAASITWNPAGWTTAGDAGTAQKTPDLKTIVQQIINRAGWSSGNSMVFIFTGTGTRIAESYEGSASQAALLTIVYSIQGTQKSGDFEISVNQPIAKSENIKCYPVPFTDKLHIEFNPAEGEQVKSIEIVNQAGSSIRQIELTENQLVMEMPDLSPGIYIVKVNTNKGFYSKLVIRK
jgi:hypothetical protein